MLVTKVKVLKRISSKRLGGRSIYPGVHTDQRTLDLLFNTLGVPKVLEKDATPSTLVVVLEDSEALKPAAVEPDTLQMVQPEEATVKLNEPEAEPAPAAATEPEVCKDCGKDKAECDKSECGKVEETEPKRRGRRRKVEEE